MKSARFSNVVAQAGKPDVYLMLIDPAKDAALQKAIKRNCVMTVHQSGASDFGTVGFEKEVSGQILVFPKSLKAFEGAKIVGVKYDLLDTDPIPKSRQFHLPAKEKVKQIKKTPAPKIPRELPPSEKVLPFQKPEPPPEEGGDTDDRITDLEKGIRHALDLLEAGKQVAASIFLNGCWHRGTAGCLRQRE